MYDSVRPLHTGVVVYLDISSIQFYKAFSLYARQIFQLNTYFVLNYTSLMLYVGIYGHNYHNYSALVAHRDRWNSEAHPLQST